MNHTALLHGPHIQTQRKHPPWGVGPLQPPKGQQLGNKRTEKEGSRISPGVSLLKVELFTGQPRDDLHH